MIRVSIAHYICIIIVFCKKNTNLLWILISYLDNDSNDFDSSYRSRRVLPTASFATSKKFQKIHFHDPKCYFKVLLKLWSKQKLANRAFVERTVVTAMARITWDFLEHVIGDGTNYLSESQRDPKRPNSKAKMAYQRAAETLGSIINRSLEDMLLLKET